MEKTVGQINGCDITIRHSCAGLGNDLVSGTKIDLVEAMLLSAIREKYPVLFKEIESKRHSHTISDHRHVINGKRILWTDGEYRFIYQRPRAAQVDPVKKGIIDNEVCYQAEDGSYVKESGLTYEV